MSEKNQESAAGDQFVSLQQEYRNDGLADRPPGGPDRLSSVQPMKDLAPLTRQILWWTLWFVLLTFFLLYYVWNAHHGLPLNLSKQQQTNYYGQLTDALLQGQLYLLQQPAPEMLALPDPYDPKLNNPWRRHDMSLYKGQYYLYFGITPSLLMWLPARAFGLYMSDEFAAAVFCWGGLVASLGFLLNIVRISGVSTRRWMWIVATPLLALGSTVPFLLQRVLVYEVVISGAYFCTMVGLFFLSRFFAPGGGVRWSLALGGLFLALAVGARPNFIFWGVTMALVSHQLARRHGGIFKWPGLHDQVALWAPYLIVGALLALYNYLRFDSFTEFGLSYQLAGINMREFKLLMFNADSLLPGLYFYLWQPLTINCMFPFFHTSQALGFYEATWGRLPAWYYGPEPVTGALRVSPFLYLLPLLPLVLLVVGRVWRTRPIQISSLNVMVVSVLAGQATVQVFFLAVLYPSATMRYMVDFMPYLLLAAVLLWFAVDDRLASIEGFAKPLAAEFPTHKFFREVPIARTFLNLVAVLLVAYGSVVHLALGMTGYSDFFHTKNPQGYQKILNKFDLLKPGGRYRTTLQISQQAEGRDPLMVIGSRGLADMVLMERSGARFRVGIDHWGVSQVWSDWIPLITPEILDLTFAVAADKINVYRGSDLLVTSLQAPYVPCDTPVFGEDRIGFNQTPERARFVVNLTR